MKLTPPQCVQLSLSLLVEDKFIQRRVVAEVSHHQVKAGAQQSPPVSFVFLQKTRPRSAT